MSRGSLLFFRRRRGTFFSVARGPVPRDRWSGEGDRFFIVARGPSDAIRASERVSPAIVAGNRFFTVARGPVLRDRCMARDRPSPYGERGVLLP